MGIEFTTTNKLPEEMTVLGVPVCSDDLDGVGDHLDVAFLAERGFEGKCGETLAAPGADGVTIVAVGMGPAADVGPTTFRDGGAALVRSSWRSAHIATTLLSVVPDDGDRAACARALAEGIGLGAYRFGRHKRDPKRCSLERATLVTTGGKKVAEAAALGGRVAEATTLARDLVNEPSGVMTPRELAEVARGISEREGLKVLVLDEVDIEAYGLGGLVGVSAGSAEPARLIQLTWEPDKPKGTLVLVGKGITFDSGGLSLKPPASQYTMKTDMSGAAAVLGAMSVVSALAPKHRVIGIVAASENMPSGTAIKPGDVITYRNGKTVEVLNTDAEGRLVLADALCLAVEEEPDAIIDVATLTGACQTALGPSIGGLMSNNDALRDQVLAAGERAGEDLWPLPLPEGYRRLLESEVADLRNIGKVSPGGALTAGLFLQEFVADVPWAHLDIAGPARSEEERGVLTVGGSGFATRTLIALVEKFKKPSKQPASR